MQVESVDPTHMRHEALAPVLGKASVTPVSVTTLNVTDLNGIDGKLLEIDRTPDRALVMSAAELDDDDDKQEPPKLTGKKRHRYPSDDTDDEEKDGEEDDDDDETQSNEPLLITTKCGLVVDGVSWSGNSQCMCPICTGEIYPED